MGRRITLALALALAVLASWPASGLATLTELGGGDNLGTPSCPGAPCLAVTRTTGFQVVLAGRSNVFRAPRTGRIVAFTVKLGAPTASQISFFTNASGGPADARIAILRPAPSTVRGHLFYRLNAQSDDFALTPYFGRTVQFPLYTSLLVRPGYLVALSVAHWAPALAVSGLNSGFSWRSSRVRPCSTNTESQPAHTLVGSVRDYFCLYRPARLSYSVTLISTP